MNNVKILDEKYYMNTFGARTPVCFTHGKGMKLYSTDNEEYTDFMGGIAVNSLGHCHPVLTQALHNQVDKLLHTSSLYYIENQALLAQKIAESSCADRVFFANTGAEANEGAIKLAKMYFMKKGQSEKNEFITLKNSFHGRTLATVAATGQEKYQKPYKPLMHKFTHVTANDIGEFKNAVTDNTCGVILELIQGESGVHPLSYEYVSEVRKICDEKEIILIFDEVQTGVGRTGTMYAYQGYGIEPDVFTLAKALGGGVPIGAVCAKEKFCAFEPGDHGTTFGGNPLATCAGLAVFKAIEDEKLLDNATKIGDYLKEKISKLSGVKEVRGKGLMIGVETEKNAKDVYNALFEKKYLCGCVGTTTLRILPPLIITKNDADEFIEILKEVL